MQVPNAVCFILALLLLLPLGDIVSQVNAEEADDVVEFLDIEVVPTFVFFKVCC